MAPCDFARSPTNPLCRSCVSKRSCCGAVRVCTLADEPSAEIVHVYVADEPSADIMRVGSLSLWRRANLHAGRRTLCGDRACRSALAVAPCEFARWPTNPLRGSCASDRSRCGAVRICTLADEPSAGIVSVGSHSLSTNPLRGSCVSDRSRCRRTLCGDLACRIALAVVFDKN